MFRKFTKTFIDEDIVTDVRDRMFYKKPSLLKKEQEKRRGKRPTRSMRPRTSMQRSK